MCQPDPDNEISSRLDEQTVPLFLTETSVMSVANRWFNWWHLGTADCSECRYFDLHIV